MGDVFESAVGAWFLTGKNPKGYEAGDGHLKSRAEGTAEFGTIMTQLATSRAPADGWLGKRVRFRADVRTENVVGWSGLWMRVDGVRVPPDFPPMLAFDNMQERALVGTNDWKTYDVVLDVAAEATMVCFGLILDGDGEAWVRAATVEVVGENVARTSSSPPIVRATILDENLEPFLISLAWIIGEHFDEEDWSEVRAGVAASDERADRRYEVPIFAARKCKVEIGRDPDENAIHVRVEPSKAHFGREIGLALEIFGAFAATKVTRRPRA